MTYDLLLRLNLLLEGLCQDAQATKNIIIFNYDVSYPRLFKDNPQLLIKACENINKYIMYNSANAKISDDEYGNEACRILFEFKLTNYSSDYVLFDVVFEPTLPITRGFDEKYLKLANREAKAMGIDLNISQKRIVLSLKMLTAQQTRQQIPAIASETLKRYHAVVSYPIAKGFEILKAQLEALGINVRPSSDFLSAFKHITDAIYTPNLVFLNSDDLKQHPQTLPQILKAQKTKGFNVIVICHDDDDKQDVDEFFYLRQPYTYDMLYSIIFLLHSRTHLGVHK